MSLKGSRDSIRDRASADYAAVVLERTLPDPSVRRAFESVLAEAIVFAHEQNPASWGITLYPDKLRLNVGQVEVIVLTSEGMYLVVDDSAVTQATKSTFGSFLSDAGIHYPSVPSPQICCRIPDRDFLFAYPDLRNAHFAYIAQAARRSTPFRRSFSPGIIRYLRCTTSCDIPFPAYFKDVHGSNDESRSPRFYFEGAVRQITSKRYERDLNARAACVAHHGAKCFVCEMDFGVVYGPDAKDFIHVHHLMPLSEHNGEHSVDPVKDMHPSAQIVMRSSIWAANADLLKMCGACCGATVDAREKLIAANNGAAWNETGTRWLKRAVLSVAVCWGLSPCS